MLKRILKHVNNWEITSVKWASKMLAIILSIIAVLISIFFVGGFIYISISFLIYRVIENLPYYKFVVTLMLIFSGSIAVGMLLLPPLWKYIAKLLTVGSGKKSCLSVFKALGS